MKIIDFEHKGQSVRFYLGKDDLKDWYGDDWDDYPYEHNAGRVYEKYTEGYTDVTFDFDDLVLEPAQDWNGGNSDYCKDDMKNRIVPCVIVVPKKLLDDSWPDDRFSRWVGADGVCKFYFGDKMAPDYVYKTPDGWDELSEREAVPAEYQPVTERIDAVTSVPYTAVRRVMVAE